MNSKKLIIIALHIMLPNNALIFQNKCFYPLSSPVHKLFKALGMKKLKCKQLKCEIFYVILSHYSSFPIPFSNRIFHFCNGSYLLGNWFWHCACSRIRIGHIYRKFHHDCMFYRPSYSRSEFLSKSYCWHLSLPVCSQF